MAYENDKDKLVKKCGSFPVENGEEIAVGIYSYNEGDEKIQISRTYTKGNGESGQKAIGRLKHAELKELLTILSNIKENED